MLCIASTRARPTGLVPEQDYVRGLGGEEFQIDCKNPLE